LGFLDFPGDQKIFPVDGQHRVEGIKASLESNPELKDQQIGVIFIGHSKDEDGMIKSRRLFTTLNRYAKPVTMDDIIALDEDDSVAIVTRNLLESFDFFNGARITKNKSKAILDTDKNSFTSLITLYQCNKELLKLFRVNRKQEAPNSVRDKWSLEDYLKFRPAEVEIVLFQTFLTEFWISFSENFDDINNFYHSDEPNPAEPFRNRISGGSLLFRPVGLLPLVQAIIEIYKRDDLPFDDIIEEINNINFTISENPWKNVLWNPTERTMIMGTQVLVKLLLLYIYDPNILRPSELIKLKEKYADKISWEGEIDEILNDMPTL
jgi:DNA sulfur modification protein DndB